MASRPTLLRIYEIFDKHRAASLSAIGAVAALSYTLYDYLTYLSYGPGGLPYNATGWLVSTVLLRAISREGLSTRMYDNPKLPFADQPGYLPASLPQRASKRPRIGPHPVPQRQLGQLPSEEIRQKLLERFSQLGYKLEARGLVEVRQSVMELQHKGIFVPRSRKWHTVAQETRGEITHVHAGLDGSIHVTLSPDDCKKVIEAGWGQRHGLDGVRVLKKLVGFIMPVNYMLIYAPRDEAEIEVAMTIVKAGIGFMTGTREALEYFSPFGV
ncbi:uncharacterized protein BDR25DRAFT_308043 [Lindgomyces ingoldianus]|uniref:Uncharacterized protein n=1 Tax=Lindgomyces ingoldianus TaxID=673940 RepID=A0ACB6Q7Y1_9PLEO|nr:uncharacterized protein BDR25DRAFT_308043 [Lindgomyces ingoldianus]KAF2462962.1 hypothetical protein BDR25DRAFT_308043 [Lindgomyces ingoldianus]